MKKVATYSALLVIGLIGAKLIPELPGAYFPIIDEIVSFLTLTGLGFIMIHVGYEFEIDKSNLKSYGWDYVVAMTAAAFPWIFVSLPSTLFTSCYRRALGYHGRLGPRCCLLDVFRRRLPPECCFRC